MANPSPTRKGFVRDPQTGILGLVYTGASPGAAALGANTALTGVFVGTPVVPALPVDSIVISNLVASGDIALVTQAAGNSQAGLVVDGSAGETLLYAAGVIKGTINSTGISIASGNDVRVVLGNLRLGTVSAFATTEPTNAVVIKTGTAPSGAITTSVALYTDGTTMKKIIADGTASDVQT